MNTPHPAPPVAVGLERCLDDAPDVLRDGRFGLLMNQASVDARLELAGDVLARRFPGQLAALFSPQHGLWGLQQANMIETPHGVYPPLGLPVYSLYSETRRPTPEMLQGLDCLVVDLQDVGTRVYTFAWTVTHCLEACRAADLPVVILDRPNPLGGVVEGPLLEAGFESFVGLARIPLRHGLTLGELAMLVNHELEIGAALQVVPLSGWRRELLWPSVGRTWIAPSPNMPRWETSLLYPGQVLLEGTNISEGRGTTMPFECAGAPFIDPYGLADALLGFDLPGLVPTPLEFCPQFDKWQGSTCGGVALRIVDPAAVRSVAASVALLACAARLWPSDVKWKSPPYEYESEKMPIDILFGSPRLRTALDGGRLVTPADVARLTAVDEPAWQERVRDCLLYE